MHTWNVATRASLKVELSVGVLSADHINLSWRVLFHKRKLGCCPALLKRRGTLGEVTAKHAIIVLYPMHSRIAHCQRFLTARQGGRNKGWLSLFFYQLLFGDRVVIPPFSRLDDLFAYVIFLSPFLGR